MTMARNKFAFLATGVVLAMALTLSCSNDGGSSGNENSSSSENNQGGNPDSSGNGGNSSSSVGCSVSAVSENSVTYGDQTYRTVKICEQVWFAENLNYEVSGSICYDNEPENCDKYGRLYDWETALTVCPSGWHLPDTTEWNVLIDFAGGYPTAGAKLKAENGWKDNGNGTDQYGFSAMPGGNKHSFNDYFEYVGNIGFWWGASENEDYKAYAHYWRINYNLKQVYKGNEFKESSLSVRCIKD